MGWQIVRRSFILLFRNFANALKVSVGPIALALLASWLIITALDVSAAQVVWDVGRGVLSTNVMLATVSVALAFIFVTAWVAVAWHRFILLEEYPGLLPAIAGRPIWTYAGRSFLLGLLMVLALVPAAMIGGLIAQIFGPEQSAVMLLLGFGLGVYFSFIWLRIGIILPATAVGRPMRIAEGWTATRPVARAILDASLILVALNMGASALLGALTGGGLALFFDLAISWVTIMVGTSILTTIYGHVVEGRSLA